MRRLSVRKNNLFKLNKDSAISIGLSLLLISLTLYPFLSPGKANAAVTESFVRFDRLGTGEAVSGSACLETTTSGTETGVIILFPSDWTVSSNTTHWTTNTTNLPTAADGTTATAWPSISANATAVNGNSVTFTGGNLANAGEFYCFNFSGGTNVQSTVGPAGNDKTGQLKTTGGSPFVDTVDWATSVVSSDADQILVTASVSATMTFSLTGNSTDLGNLSSGSTSEGDPTIVQEVSTNARNGWISWVKSGTDGGLGVGALHSVVANADIDSPGTFNGSPDTLTTAGGYVLDVDATAGAPTINGEYNGVGADDGGHLDQSQFRQTATANDPADADQVTLKVRARASNTTPAAADYTDTLTVVAAGSF